MGATKIRKGQVDSTIVVADGTNAFTGDQSMGSHKLTNVTDPTSAQDAATKAYVDAVATGLDVKASCRVATTASITLSGTQTIDGVSVIANDRVLVKNQSTGSQNGIYVCAAGSWSRSTDADQSAEVTTGMFTFIEEGTANAGTGWVLTTANPIVIGTTALTFSQFSGAGTYSGGNGITFTGTVISANLDANGGLEFNSAATRVKLDGSSLARSSSGLKVDLTRFIVRETPSGTINGSNVTFTLAQTPVSGMEEIYLNGLQQDAGGAADYTISGATITFNTAPMTGDKLRVSYVY